MTNQSAKHRIKVGLAEVIARTAGEIVGSIIAKKFKAKETIAEAPKKSQLDSSNYAIINRNLQKKLDEGVSSEDEKEILKQMVYNYGRMQELGYLKGD